MAIAARLGLEPVPDEFLGAAVGLAPGRHRIHLGGVDEIDTVIEGVIELRAGFVKRVLLTEGHGAEADFRDFQAARTQCIELHGVLYNKNAILAPVMGNLKSMVESESRSGWK